MKVAATAINDIGGFVGTPGAFSLFVTWQYPEVAGLNYVCPCGCGTIGEVRFTHPGQSPRSPTYLWDGNREKPTVVPAIRTVSAGQVCWEGALQSGVWIGERNDIDDGSSTPAIGDPSGA